MKAVRVHEFGDASALRYEEVPVPEPGPRDILVRVEAAGLNRADLGRRSGTYRGGAPALPFTPGFELAGTVEAVGSEVQGFRSGQRVAANPSDGAYAEYALVRPTVTCLIPEGVSTVDAGSVPVVFLTSWFPLVKLAELKAGETALIQSGGSGVGIAGIQIAKHLGARVITTAGTDEKCRKARELGADEAINYTTQDFAEEVRRLTEGRGVDVVLESVGGEVYRKSIEVLVQKGRLVTVGRSGGPIPEIDESVIRERELAISSFGLFSAMAPGGGGLEELEIIFGLFKAGRFKAVVDRVFPLAEAAAAHRHLEERRNFGKVVLVP